jgi:hypothetical protein
MPRKSSVHFKPVANVRFAVSHAERTDLSEPAYLLPKEHQLDNVIVTGSLSENELAALFIQQKEGMTGQAKARGSSPFWEGVVVLPNTDSQEQSANLLEWKSAYEKTTGHKVLHMSIHLDEGYIDTTGKPQYNPHAHVIVSRMDEKNRVIKLERKELAAVQDLTAIALKMERGSTLAERSGKRGRAHIGHREFRAQADATRLDLDVEKSNTGLEKSLTDSLLQRQKTNQLKLKEVQAVADKVPDLAAEIARLNEQYRLDREAMKASGTAKQADYQKLKKEHEATLAKLAITEEKLTFANEKVETMTQENKALSEANAKLEAQTEADRVRFAAMANQYQAEKAEGKNPALFVPAPAPLPSPSKQSPAPMAPEAQHHARMAQPLLDKAAAIRRQVASGEKSDIRLVTAVGYELAAAKISRIAQEASKAQTQPIHALEPQKTLVERLAASLQVFLDWVKGKGGKAVVIDLAHSDHYGPVVQLDDLHAVQKIGRGEFAVHQLDHLDKLPALDDPKMEIHYRGGVGKVKAQGITNGKGGRAD